MTYNRFRMSIFGSDYFCTHITTDSGRLHCHDFYEISYVVRGAVQHITPDTETFLTNDKCMILRPDDVHSFDEKNNKSTFHRDVLVSKDLFKTACDFLSPTLFDEINNSPSIPTISFSLDEFKSCEDSVKFFSSIENDQDKQSAFARAIVINFLTLYLKNRGPSKTANKKLIDDIIEIMKTPNVLQNGIPALIREVNYSHGHLCRLIKQNLGRKLLDILTELRMEHAALTLKTTNVPLVDIAASVGYESLSHFISVFEKYFFTSPYKYRNSFKNK